MRSEGLKIWESASRYEGVFFPLFPFNPKAFSNAKIAIINHF